MIYKVVCSGKDDFTKLYKKDEEEVLIAVDGGIDILHKMSLKPFAFYGDFDSTIKKCDKISDDDHIYSSIKDFSDLELALNDIMSKLNKEDKVLIYNATGMRLDHFTSAVNCIIKNQDYPLYLIDEENIIYMSDVHMKEFFKGYKYISFFSVLPTRVTLKNFLYELDNYLLYPFDNLCISNEILANPELITDKKVLIMQTR